MTKIVVGLLAAFIIGASLWTWATMPNPQPGDGISVTRETIGCRIINPVSGEWSDCRRVPEGSLGVVEDHPDGLGHLLSGRTRVRLASDRVVVWIPSDHLR